MSAAHGVLFAIIAAAPQAQDTVPLYDDLGGHHHAITTTSPRAQQYFDQGLRLIYGFNHGEAIASFQEALRSDASCAMCWWGIAQAYGPNINLPMDSASGAAAYDAARRAQANAPGTTPLEQAFIRAVVARYGANPTADRARLDSAFAGEMVAGYRAFPGDDDVATLYADALMNLVRMSQNAARLVAELMEPDTEDSLVAWNFLDHSLPATGSLANRQQPYFLPMVRVMRPAGVRSTLVR